MGDTIVIETPVATVLEVSGLQGPQGVPGASQADVLTVQGDLLYRGASAAQRLGIGTAGQILKVNSGGTAPEWGAAPAAGVSSVNGQTGAVDLDAADISAANAIHDHQPSDIYSDAVTVTATTQSAGEPNGVYLRNGSDNGKATYRSAAGYSIWWDSDEGEWVLGNVSQSHKYFIGSQDTTYPWQVSIAWTLGAQGSGTVPTVGQATLTDYQLNAAQDSVSTRVPKSGNATSTEVVLGSDTRLTNSRTPTAHAASHASAGSDPLAPSDIGAADASHAHSAYGEIQNAILEDPSTAFSDLVSGLGTDPLDPSGSVSGVLGAGQGVLYAVSDFAEASHTHAASDITSGSFGNISHDGKLGSTAGLPVVTTTAGAVTTLALGTANQVLRVNSGATGVEFADPAASGVSSVSSSASDVLGVSGANITGVDANADRIIFFDDSAGKLTHLTVGSGLSISDTTISATATGTIGGSTGATDNAVLRADGTGGSTSQNSDIIIDDAATSTQANVALRNNHSETDSALVLTPKGTGAFIVGPKPDGTSTGGNARGTNAIDLQTVRSTATQVASGIGSIVLAGDRCSATSVNSIAGGRECTASGAQSVALGRNLTASGSYSACIGGEGNVASGIYSHCFASGSSTASGAASFVLGGDQAAANRSFLIANSSGRFAVNGDSQWVHIVLRAKTTTNSAVELLAGGFSAASSRLTCPSGKIISGIINIHGVKSDGSASAHYVRQFQVKNVGGTSTYPYTAATVGTDYASSTSITFNDPDTNDALSVSVTGIVSETWRWTAHVSAVETAYGT